MKSRVAVADKYQPYAGSLTKMKVPCQIARTSFDSLDWMEPIVYYLTYLK